MMCRLRTVSGLLVVIALVGACVPAVQQSSTSASPPAPPPISSQALATGVLTGEDIAQVATFCNAGALNACPAATLRCEGYRNAYVKTCMVRLNVPAEFVELYTD